MLMSMEIMELNLRTNERLIFSKILMVCVINVYLKLKKIILKFI